MRAKRKGVSGWRVPNAKLDVTKKVIEKIERASIDLFFRGQGLKLGDLKILLLKEPRRGGQ